MANDLFKELDRDVDGVVSFEEFWKAHYEDDFDFPDDDGPCLFGGKLFV